MQKTQTTLIPTASSTEAPRQLGGSMLRLLQSHELRVVHGGGDSPSDPTPPTPTGSNRSRKR